MDNSSESSEDRLVINLSFSNKSRQLDSGIQTISDSDISNDHHICEGDPQSQNFDPVHQEIKAVTSCCHSKEISKGQEQVTIFCDIPENVNFGNEYQRASTPIPGKSGSSAEFDLEFLLEDQDYRLQTNTDEAITCTNEQQTGSFSINMKESNRNEVLDPSDLHPRGMYYIPTDNITFDCNDRKADNKISDFANAGKCGIQEHGYNPVYSTPPVPDFQERELRCATTKAKIISMITSVKNPCLIKQDNQIHIQKTAIDMSVPRPQYKRYPKPPYTYLGMIVVAIENSIDKQLTLSEIHQVLRDFFPFFCGLYTGWKDSVRHNLSNNHCFYKVPKDPYDSHCRQHYWRVDLEKVPVEAFRRHEKKDMMKGEYALYIHDHLGLPPIRLPSETRRKLFLEEKRRKNAIDQIKVNSNNNSGGLNLRTEDQEEPCSHDKKSGSYKNHTDSVCIVAEPQAKRFKGEGQSDKNHCFVRPIISDEAHQILSYFTNRTITDVDSYSALQNLSWLCQSSTQYNPALYAWQAACCQMAHYPVPQVYNGMTPGRDCEPHGYQMLDNSYASRTLPHNIARDNYYMYRGHPGYLPLQTSSMADSNPLETFADYALTYSHQN